MINLSKTKPIWLVEPAMIGQVFSEAVSATRAIFKDAYPGANRNTSYKKIINALDAVGSLAIRTWGETEINTILECCYWNGRKISSTSIFSSHKNSSDSLTSFFKAVFILLWGKELIILPLDFTLPVNQDTVLDRITQHTESETLKLARSTHPNSSIAYTGTLTIQDRLLRANSWYRITLSTTCYQPSDLEMIDSRELYWASVGARGSILQRYYIKDFLTTVGNLGKKSKEIKVFLEEERQMSSEEKKADPENEKQNNETSRKQLLADHSLLFLQSKNYTTSELAQHYNNTALIRNSFGISPNSTITELAPGYRHTSRQVRELCLLVNDTYNKFCRANPLQNSRNRTPPLQYLLCYCALYLYAFYQSRDGNLSNYPRTLNDLFTPAHFTADEELLEGIAQYETEQPQTFLQYFDTITEINGWSPETRNQRARYIEELHIYIETNGHLLPNANTVRNTFSKSHYSRIKKRGSTVKKSIPRAYFATFIDMLYSLEYLVMHLNEMAAGTIPGVKYGELSTPSIVELSSDPYWAGIWGKGELTCEAVDQTALNYCPIFYHDNTIKKFEYIPRFYRVTSMTVKRETSKDEYTLKIEPRVITNDIRLTQLMCETGIRQQHLIWLDRDEYDKYVPTDHNKPLAPLFVSTDKAHGPWSAIISRYVMDILKRQRDWYDTCMHPSFQDPLWYGGTENSAFGVMRPLFRTELSIGSWNNYRGFRLLLVALQYFIRKQLLDLKTRDLIYLKTEKGLPNKSFSHLDKSDLSKLSQLKLISDITPHGLRAGFVSEAIKFLPPSLVGRYLTGQSENLVYYYLLLDDEGELSHDELLCQMLMRNQQRLSDGTAPLMAEAVLKLNKRLHQDISKNPGQAIDTHRLMSLTRLKNGPNGLDLIRAKDVTDFAFNATHICPFNNICPKEVIDMLGTANACALCPFAVRGVDHLPAIGAQKDQYKELMLGVLNLIQELLLRKQEHRSPADMERLEREHDHYARQAVMLEAIELQLVEMANNGQHNFLIAKNSQEIVGHYKLLKLESRSNLLKRLIDTQSFPDLTSPDLDCRLSMLRGSLLMHKGDIRSHLMIEGGAGFTPTSKASSLISSLVRAKTLNTFDIYKICASAEEAHQVDTQPSRIISNYLTTTI